MSRPVLYELENDTAILTMDDTKANAFGPTMIGALSEAFDRAEEEAKAIILTGRPGVLSAGFDLKVMKDGPEATAAMVGAGARLLLKIYLHPLPVITASTGHAIAAGAIILLASDVRIGAAGAFSIGLNETSIGMALPPFGVELARDRLSPGALSPAVLGATLYSPEEAASIGYLDRVCAGDTLLDTAKAAAAHYATLDGRSYAATKINLRQATVDRITPTLAGIKL